jgi:hypothetical protein
MARGSRDLDIFQNLDLAKFLKNENGKRFKGLSQISKPGLSQIS